MYYKFIVTYIDEDSAYESVRVNGIVYADSMSEAVEKLSDCYGKEELDEINLLTAVYDCDVLDLDADWKLKEDYDW